MGCHTWTYKKVSALTDEEKQHFVENELEPLKNWWGFRMTEQEVVNEVKQWYTKNYLNVGNNGPYEEYAKNLILEFKQKIDDLEKNGFDAYLRICKDSYPTCFEHNGEIYVNIDTDIPFRVFGYPEHQFINGKDNLVAYLQSLDSEDVEYYGHEGNRGYAYYNGVTEELKKIIDGYFEKHGEENIMFDFG